MEKREHEPRTEEPRSLWDRLESSLQRQEVFTIRRIIGEEIIDRNQALWTEVGALEDILREAQDQNADISQKLEARQLLPASLERTLLEAHLKLLLQKLGAVEEAGRRSKEGYHLDGNEGETGRHFASDSNGNGKHPAFAMFGRSCSADGTTKNVKQEARRSTSSLLASSGAPPQPEVCRAAQEPSISRDNPPSNGLESERSSDAAKEVEDRRSLWGACNTTQNRGGYGYSRPSTASRPGSSRSARSEAVSDGTKGSAPGCLGLSPPAVDIDTIDGALDDLRAAFAQEAKYLLEQVAELVSMLEGEASRKIDAERRSKENSAGNFVGTSSSDLHSRVKKLEEAVRLHECTAVRTVHPRLLPLDGPLGQPGFTSDRDARRSGWNRGGNGMDLPPNTSSTPLLARHASGEIGLRGEARGSRASGRPAQDGFRPVLPPGSASDENDAPRAIGGSCLQHRLISRRKGCHQDGPGIATGMGYGHRSTPSRDTTPKDHDKRSEGSKLDPSFPSKGRAENNACANRRTDAREKGESSRADNPGRRTNQQDLPGTLPSKLRSMVRTAQGGKTASG